MYFTPSLEAENFFRAKNGHRRCAATSTLPPDLRRPAEISAHCCHHHQSDLYS